MYFGPLKTKNCSHFDISVALYPDLKHDPKGSTFSFASKGKPTLETQMLLLTDTHTDILEYFLSF